MSLPHDDPLTPREREVLLGVLDRRTAKQMGQALGISHHAVEQRLKRARIKLGEPTSLDAARAWEERYGRTASGPSDVPDDLANLSPEPSKPPPTRRRFDRRIAMSAISLTALAGVAAAALGTEQPSTPLPPSPRDAEFLHEYEMTIDGVSVEEATQLSFAVLDEDKSGGITVDEFVDDALALGAGIKRLQTEMFRLLDDNDDGMLDRHEFIARTVSDADGGRYRLALNPDSDEAKVAAALEAELFDQWDEASRAFDTLDRDKSGRIERGEWVSSFEAALGDDEVKERIEKAGIVIKQDLAEKEQARVRREGMFALIDRDSDGVVNKSEYLTHALENHRRVFTLPSS